MNFRKNIIRSFIFLALLSFITPPCFSACDFDWKPGEGIPGINGEVYAVTTWDPDGAGPEPNLVVVAGNFTFAGNIAANNIAAWDGSSWQAFGSGTNGSVSALTVCNGQLIAGGGFTTAGGVDANYIARWDGSSWQAMGSGMGGFDYPYLPFVDALTVYNGQLIAGGWFSTAGGVDAKFIARWDGSSWQALGSGMDYTVYALTVYNGQLIAGGGFTMAGGVIVNNIAAWDGSNWQALESGMNGGFGVTALTVYNGQLIAGGAFTTAGGVSVHEIASWDGSGWHALGSGTSAGVYALTVYNGQLIAGGDFAITGGASAKFIARWDGSSWQALGSGMQDWVSSLTVYNGQLIAGGRFTTAGGVDADSIARWDGSSWQTLTSGISGWPSSLTVYNGQLIEGGGFVITGSPGLHRSTNPIERWDGSSWQALGSGISDWVDALTVYDGQLIAGGDFTRVGGIDVNYIAAWNGSSWHALGSGLKGGQYTGFLPLTVYKGQLIAGGGFTMAGGVDANYIAAWNGSSWQALGSGMKDRVQALTVYNGQLIAGGYFTTAGGVSANHIARWDGSSWQALGSGMNGSVSAFTVYNGQLIAGGSFITAGGVDANHIARWDGSSWQALGSGTNGIVSALTVYNSQLIAGGGFTTAGGVIANYIARWDGSSWQAMGSGMGGTDYPYDTFVYALTVYNDQLIAGGNFTTAGGKVSFYWVRWGVPTIYAGDLNHDCAVDINDLALFTERWLDSDCLYDGWCNGIDLNYSTQVNFEGYALLAANWGVVGNCPPVVDAGFDQTIMLPADANICGTVTDDGLPNPPGHVTTLWTKVRGPDVVTFGDANAVCTTASFAGSGVYVLRLTANDSNLIAYDEVQITVQQNQQPVVNAGADQQIMLPANVTLDGAVTDDGLPNPPAAVTTLWTKQSGPGTVTFGDAAAIDTTASFSATGTYVLRLTANDSLLSAYDEVTISVSTLPSCQFVAGTATGWNLGDGSVLLQTIYGTAQDSSGNITANAARALSQNKGEAMAFNVPQDTALGIGWFKLTGVKTACTLRVRLFNVTGKGYLTYNHTGITKADPGGTGNPALIDISQSTGGSVPGHSEGSQTVTDLIVNFGPLPVTAGDYFITFDATTGSNTLGNMVRGVTTDITHMTTYPDGSPLPKRATVTTSSSSTGNTYHYELSATSDTTYTPRSYLTAFHITTDN